MLHQDNYGHLRHLCVVRTYENNKSVRKAVNDKPEYDFSLTVVHWMHIQPNMPVMHVMLHHASFKGFVALEVRLESNIALKQQWSPSDMTCISTTVVESAGIALCAHRLRRDIHPAPPCPPFQCVRVTGHNEL